MPSKMETSANRIMHASKQLACRNYQEKLVLDLEIMTRLIATHLTQETNLSDLLVEILDATIGITGADKGNIQLLDEEQKVLKIVVSRGFSQSFLEYFALCLAGKGTCGLALENGGRIFIADINTSPFFIGTPHLPVLLAEGVQAVQSTPLKSSSGKILGMVSTHYYNPQNSQLPDFQIMDLLACLTADVIERRAWATERAKWLEKLREADQNKNNFLGVLSHELRNPLASIANSLFTLANAPAGSYLALRAQTSAEGQVKHMTRLVDDLLDVTRIAQNKIQLRLQTVDLNELVYRTIEDHRISFELATIFLEVAIPDTPLMIQADPARISQAIGNLLHNAMKFTNNGGKTLLSVEKENDTNDAVIRIIDDGVGIEPCLLENIFLPFVQENCALDRGKSGLGLGLTLVKTLIEQHGGSVKITSDGRGKGTQAMIRLPSCSGIPSQKPVKKQLEIHSKSEIRILLIEDNRDVAESFRDVLELYKYQVFTAHNGQDGVNKALEINPHFVICDIGLPDINGFEVVRVFKSNPRLSSIFIIGLSGYAHTAYMENARQAGFDVYLAKPLNMDILQQIIISHIEKLDR